VPEIAAKVLIERETREGVTSYALRFRAHGRRRFVHLGYSPGWTRKRAEQGVADILADVRRGLWRPPDEVADAEPPVKMPTPARLRVGVDRRARGRGLAPAHDGVSAVVPD